MAADGDDMTIACSNVGLGGDARGATRAVVAVGVDTAEVASVEEALARRPERYLAFVLTEREHAECLCSPEPLAVAVTRRWAAKEAVTKVLAPSPDDPWPWTHVEVLGLDVPGGPTARTRLHGRPAELAHELGIDRVEVAPAPTGAPSHRTPRTVTVTAVGLTPACRRTPVPTHSTREWIP